MIKSMTGYGCSEAADKDKSVSVEIRGVNHRYLDLSTKIPKRMNPYELMIRNKAKQCIARGKVDIFVSYEDKSIKENTLVYNEALAKRYMEIFSRISESFDLVEDIGTSRLASCPDVITFSSNEESDDTMTALLDKALCDALLSFNDSREAEGQNLCDDLLIKLDELYDYVSDVEERYPDVIASYRQRLTDKVNELLSDASADESRIATEIVVYADKICVDEETVRLKSHIDAMKNELKNEGSIGKKLDFIAQEMNRESNTILSKSSDSVIADIAIRMKTLVEKIREQVQNIE